MNSIEHALLAVRAADSGDTTTAADQLTRAQHRGRATARRDRQIVQIAALIVAGAHERAAGLAFEHILEFCDDVELLTLMTGGSR